MSDLEIVALKLINFSIKILNIFLFVLDVLLLFFEQGIVADAVTTVLLNLFGDGNQLLLLDFQLPLQVVRAMGRKLPLEPISLSLQSVDLCRGLQQLCPQLFNQVAELLITLLHL